MQVGDLPLVFELSGIHTPPKGGGGEKLAGGYSSASSGMESRPNANGLGGFSSGLPSRPNIGPTSVGASGTSSKPNGRLEEREGRASLSRSKGRSIGSDEDSVSD